MLSVDKKALHAVQAILTISSHHGAQPISGKEIASVHDITPRYLEQMLQRLVKAEILVSVRGANGGYILAREKRHISVADIIQAIKADNDETVLRADYEELNGLILEVQKQMDRKYQSVTLEELTPKALPINKIADFTI